MSTFTPLSRLFSNERKREGRETRELFAKVERLHNGSRYAEQDAIPAFIRPVWEALEDRICARSTASAFIRALHETAASEKTIFDLPTTNFDFLTMVEAVEFRKFLRAKEYFFAHEELIAGRLREGLTDLFGGFARHLPETEEDSPFAIPLVHVLPKELFDFPFGLLQDQRFVSANLFTDLFRQLWFNLCEASGILDPFNPKKAIILPSKSDLPPEQAVKEYFKGTPFLDLLLSPVLLKLTYEDRFSHMHIVGGSGAGKTQLLQHLILHDLDVRDPPALIIIDSQTDLVAKLSRLERFDPTWGKSLRDRFVLIDPRDIRNPPALNIFDVNRKRMDAYDEVTREQVTAGVIQTFDYLFNGLLGADLTAKQGVFFKFVARLMLALPDTMGRNATILDIVSLMENAEPYREVIGSLPPIQRNFFERDFLDPKNSTFKQTREQIRYRLNAILENPTLARLFTAPETKLDLFTAINNRSVILVDTAKDFLKGASGHFGRIFISLVLQAILERAAIPEEERVPAFLIVDEAASYFDSNIDDLLTEARKYKLGCVFAHQFLDQATPALRASLASNTRIKMASGVSHSDARALAPEMRTTPEFILNQPRLSFAAFVRGVTPQAVSVPVEAGVLERRSRMDEDAYLELREMNRQRVCLPTPALALPPPDVPEPPTAHRMAEPDPALRRPTPPDDGTATSKDW